jgi:hypothetical protein
MDVGLKEVPWASAVRALEPIPVVEIVEVPVEVQKTIRLPVIK